MKKNESINVISPDRGKHSGLQKQEKDFSRKVEEAIFGNKKGSKRKGKKDNSASRSILFIVFKVSGYRRRDIDGMVSTVLDCLVHSGILSDDNLEIIPGEISTFVRVPKGEEGFDIIISKSEPEDEKT